MRKHLWLFGLLIPLIGLLTGCGPNQVEHTYTAYDDAVADDFFADGWIPEQAITPTMVNVFCISDRETKTCIFGYQAAIEDIEHLRGQMQFTDAFVQLPESIKQPKWWIDILTNSENYVLQNGDDLIYIAIQNEGNTVLGWRL